MKLAWELEAQACGAGVIPKRRSQGVDRGRPEAPAAGGGAGMDMTLTAALCDAMADDAAGKLLHVFEAPASEVAEFRQTINYQCQGIWYCPFVLFSTIYCYKSFFRSFLKPGSARSGPGCYNFKYCIHYGFWACMSN